jgi:aminoglycoside 3-N-acetyltransferase
MSEAELIARTPLPRTRDSIAADLRQLGVTEGMTLLVHSSLSSLGWVCGGAVAVVQALMDTVTPSGTLVMPTFTGDYCDPEHWPVFIGISVPEDWYPLIREAMPAFDPRTTPTRGMGQIVEVFRAWPGTIRTTHPRRSFAAWGRHAQTIASHHPLDFPLGEASPLGRIYELDSWVLLLGVGYEYNTSFHLAEDRAWPGSYEAGGPVMEAGRRVWKTYQYKGTPGTHLYPIMGSAFEETGQVKIGRIGSAEAKLFPQRPLVDFAARWIAELPKPGSS